MVLSDVDIIKAVEAGDIKFSDFDKERVQPASYDILLGDSFILTEPQSTAYVDPQEHVGPKTREVVPEDGKFVLHPGVSVLGKSLDHFGSDNYLIQISGKSSLARIGLLVHNTAGIVNPGHFLNVTLELYNLSSLPIILRHKMEIAQLLFFTLSTPPKQSYKNTGRYNEDNWHTWKPGKNDKS